MKSSNDWPSLEPPHASNAKPDPLVSPAILAIGGAVIGLFLLVWLVGIRLDFQLLTLLALTMASLGGLVLVGSYYVMQQVLRSQKEEASRLNAILSSIADGVIVQDMAGNIVTMNPSAHKILETLSNDFSSEVQDIKAATRQARAKARLSSMLNYLAGLEYDDPQDVEIGRRVLNARSAPVVIPGGERFGSVFVLRDITSEVESKQLKDDFITSISHELRTPLAVIKSSNDLLRMRAIDLAEEQTRIFTQTIDSVDKNIAELVALIEQMLDLTQISAGYLGIDREPIDLVEVVRQEAELWRDRVAAKGLAYYLALPDETVWVDGDELRLMRVVRSLLKNAYSYTLAGGTITVSVRSENQQVQVNIQDTGVGIADKHQPFIFARFFRAIHEEHTYEIAGGGLGLFLSQAIIEAHGGRIWFESRVNEGSTFSFILPALSDEE